MGGVVIACSAMARCGVYPGSFNPPTVAHIEVARAAVTSRGLDRLDLMVSRVALVKGPVAIPTLAERVSVLEAIAERIEWLEVVVTEAQLLVEMAEGYDVLVMGADKWHQIQDPVFYGGSIGERDRAMARLPEVAVAPRAGFGIPEGMGLDLDADLGVVSSTAVRDGRHDWMHPVAAEFDRRTGAWTDPTRYARLAAGRMG